MKKSYALLSLSVVLAGSAHAINLIQNGSFETGPTPGSFSTLAAGSTAITGWTVGPGGIDYIGSYWVAQDGVRSIDLSGSAPGSIFQSFNTTTGQAYKVTFWLSGNDDDRATTKVTLVSAGNVTSQSFTSNAGTNSNMNWQKFEMLFTAAAPTTTLNFASGENDAYGPALDNVSVDAVPEPVSLGLIAAGLGMALKRRKRN